MHIRQGTEIAARVYRHSVLKQLKGPIVEAAATSIASRICKVHLLIKRVPCLARKRLYPPSILWGVYEQQFTGSLPLGCQSRLQQ